MQKLTSAIFLFFLCLNSFAQNGWNVLTSATTYDLLDIQAYRADTVFAVGDDGIIINSLDGGATFTVNHHPGDLIYTAVFFKNDTEGFVGNGGGNLLHTYDRGQNFIPESSCICFIKSIFFSTDQLGLYAGGNTYRSSDGGNTFSALSPNVTGGKLVAPVDSIYIQQFQQSIRRSVDYGQTFTSTVVHSATNYPLLRACFDASLNGYALTSDGYLYQSSDLGANWNLQATPSLNITISSFVFLDSLRGFMVAGSNKNQIYRTVNGGQTWTFDYTTAQSINALTAYGQVVYACGNSGYVIKNDFFSALPETQNASLIQVFPNPTQSELKLVVPQSLVGEQCALLDLTGRVLQCAYIDEKETNLSLDGFDRGVYVLRVGASQGIRVVKE